MGDFRFKPYYKWNTFNTKGGIYMNKEIKELRVLNLIINGIPSIQKFYKEVIR